MSAQNRAMARLLQIERLLLRDATGGSDRGGPMSDRSASARRRGAAPGRA